MTPIGYQPGYYGPQQPLFQINIPGLTPPPQSALGSDVASLMNSKTSSAVAVASVALGGAGGMNVGYNSMRSYSYRGASSFGDGTFAGAMKTSLIVGAAMSVGINLWRLANNQENFQMAATNVTGDLVATGVCGAVGAGATMLASAVLGGMLGGGLLLTLCTGAAGLAGMLLADNMLRQSQWFNRLEYNVFSMFQ